MTTAATAAPTNAPTSAAPTGPDGQPVTAPAATTPPTQEPTATPPAPAPEAIGDPATPPAVPEASAEGEAFTYQETGDPGLDVALGFVGNLGFGPTHPAIADAIAGKFDKLEAHLSALGDKATGYERMIALAKAAYERSEAETQTHQTTITTTVHETVGGAEAWTAIKTWAGQNADPAEKAEINAMLAAGPVQARAAAMMLADLYRSAGGTVVNPANPVSPTAGNYAPTNSGALSPNDYANEVRSLRASLGGRDLDSSPEYAALKARRLAWRG